MARISVDFPHPFGPRIATCSPVRMRQVHVVQHDSIAARHIHLAQLKKVFRLRILRHSSLCCRITGFRFIHLLD